MEIFPSAFWIFDVVDPLVQLICNRSVLGVFLEFETVISILLFIYVTLSFLGTLRAERSCVVLELGSFVNKWSLIHKRASIQTRRVEPSFGV